jgi:hypothetical protein
MRLVREPTETMRVYLVRGDLAFGWLRPVRDGSWHWRGGAPVSWPWQETEFAVASENAVAEFVAVDCLAMNTGVDGLILSQFARTKLDALLSPAGEFWPVRVLGRQYWWFNCLACIDALDRRRTDADWSVVEGDWGSFHWITTTRRLAFRVGRLKTATAMFRVPEYPQGALFGGEALERAVGRHELTGFRFDLVWSSEGGGVTDPPGVGFGGVFDAAPAPESERARARAKMLLERRAEAGDGR